MSQLEVTIEQGTLRGTTGTDLRGNVFLKFQGIPYAKPPLGHLRFKAPLPPEKWTGIFDASKEGDVCFARDPLKNYQTFGSENCLVLNVFTQRFPKNPKDLRPVLFWIHGGASIFGSGSEENHGPGYILTEDVVLVTINYRLGLLGFLSFDDPSLDIPGNAGLKDQVMALKWVQKNISKFGGDPNNVTVFGQSGGGGSAHLLTLSPMGKGLFHKAIAQSGCVLNPWAQGQSSSNLLATAMGLDGTDDKKIYEILLTKSLEEIHKIQEKLDDRFVPSCHRPIGLVIEKNSREPFLDQEPIEIMLAGKFYQVPFMLGYNSREALLTKFYEKSNAPEDAFFEDIVPWNFGYKKGSPEEQAVIKRIKNFYLGKEEFTPDTLYKKYDAIGDAYFIIGIYLTIMTQLRHTKAPIYLYKLSVETELNLTKKMLKIQIPGVSHSDDLGYLFKQSLSPEIKPGSIEDISVTKIVKLWTNFAKFGNPTPEKDDLLKVIWKSVTGLNLDYLDIGKDLVLGINPEIERINFWKKLFSESPAGKKMNVKI